MIVLLLALAFASLTMVVQPPPIECPLPPYQLPLLPPERASIDANGDVVVSGVETPFDLPGDLVAQSLLWSDDGEALLIEARDGFTLGVFAVQAGELKPMLDNETLLALRTEDFRDAVTLFNPAFVPGTHTVLFNTEVLSDAEGIYFELPLDLWSLDLDSGALTELLPYGEAGRFAISPDGQQIVLMDFDSIWVTDINARNPRSLYDGTVWIGVGGGVIEPAIVWDGEAAVPTLRAMLFPEFDPNAGRFDAPFAVYEFMLGAEPSSTVLFSGQTDFLMAATLSPDGYRVVEWRWNEPLNPVAVDVWITSYGDPTDEAGTIARLLTIFDVPQGVSPFVEWADETHLLFGYFLGEERVEWRIDLCGEIVPVG